MNHAFLITCAGILAGAIASISGFGIGSILTPLLATWIGTKLAVAVVSIPHFIGTALRFAVIRARETQARARDLFAGGNLEGAAEIAADRRRVRRWIFIR